MKNVLLIILLSAFYLNISAQTLKGVVQDKNDKSPLIGANVYWLGTSHGTITNAEGKFSLMRPDSNHNKLIISYVGYAPDTIALENQTFIEINLTANQSLETVEVKSTSVNVEPIQSELLTVKELKKAACCNLSESFETNASVDVSTSDAVTGTKQIRLLGLDGTYSQIMTENVPSIRGLASRSGLYFIPGTWVKSIDINKGAGSVVNGYESIAGQINVELAKPQNSEKLLFNAYTNMGGRWEFNVNTAQKVSEKWSTAILAHFSNLPRAIDQNDDGYMDVPKFTQANLLNRWQYSSENFEMQLGIKALYDDKIGGQNSFNLRQDRNLSSPFGVRSQTKRLEGWGKFGFMFPKNPMQSIGIIASASRHEQHSFFGLNDYHATQNYFYLNGIFQTEFAHNHLFKAGLSYVSDSYTEHFEARVPEDYMIHRTRQESVPGMFAEYSAKIGKKIATVAGLRADFHNLYGNFVSPRLHFKYDVFKNTALRLSAGRGFRVANPLVESASYLASARKVLINSRLQPEMAWNYGGSLTQNFTLDYRKGMITLDFYRTDFQNQVIWDLDKSANEIHFYNLKGKSFANSFQAQIEYEVLKNFDVKLAYKRYQVMTTIDNQLRELPFVPQDRLFANFGVSTLKHKWDFDLTLEWFGKQRLPNNHQVEHNLPEYSPSYLLINAQITRNFKKWEVYLGGENLGNYRQENPIMNPQMPYNQGFDAAMVYAPIMGAMVYTGVRFYVK
ncbi:MAG: TonB-dependent receptor [Microscillaceae bacterium]|jgi:outer membrane receptor protein involved in Fe transport|nr:TonB-dependent receptor [Microscillaceae bacterium]